MKAHRKRISPPPQDKVAKSLLKSLGAVSMLVIGLTQLPSVEPVLRMMSPSHLISSIASTAPRIGLADMRSFIQEVCSGGTFALRLIFDLMRFSAETSSAAFQLSYTLARKAIPFWLLPHMLCSLLGAGIAFAISRGRAPNCMCSQASRVAPRYENSPCHECRKEEVKHLTLTLEGVEYPEYWTKQAHNLESFLVPSSSPEYEQVMKEFLKSGVRSQEVKGLYRNQNKTLWMWYYLKRKEIAARNKGNANEKFFFHGSRSNAYDTIIADGFDHRVAALSGAIGAGTYFAPVAITSLTYCGRGGGTDRKMLYCRVVTGDVGLGAHGLRRPPTKSSGSALYDSVATPGMTVIFDNYQEWSPYKDADRDICYSILLFKS